MSAYQFTAEHRANLSAAAKIRAVGMKPPPPPRVIWTPDMMTAVLRLRRMQWAWPDIAGFVGVAHRTLYLARYRGVFGPEYVPGRRK